MCGPSKQISPTQRSASFSAISVSVASYKGLRYQQGQPVPTLGLQTPDIYSRNIIAHSRVCGLPPKVSPRMHRHAWATRAVCFFLLNLLPKESTGWVWLPGNGLAMGNLWVGGAVSRQHGVE